MSPVRVSENPVGIITLCREVNAHTERQDIGAFPAEHRDQHNEVSQYWKLLSSFEEKVKVAMRTCAQDEGW